MIPILLASFLFLLLMAIISVYGYRAYVRPAASTTALAE